MSRPAPSLLRLAALVITQITGWGTLFYPAAVFGREMAAELDLPAELVFSGVSIMLGVGALTGPSIGRWLKARGAREVLMLGSITSVVGMIAMANVAGAVSFVCAWLVVGIAGAMALATPAFTALVEADGPKARRLMTYLLIFSAGSASVYWPLTTWAYAHLGWRGTFLLFALIQAGLCLPLHALTIPRFAGGAALRPDVPAPAAPLLPPERVWTGFALFSIACVTSSFVSWGLSIKLLDYLEASGATPAYALTLGTVLGLFQVVVRGLDLIEFRRFGVPELGIVAMVAGALSFLVLLTAAPSSAALAGFIVIYGLATGYLTVLRATLPLALFGAADFAIWTGRLSAIMNFGLIFAPLFFTYLLGRIGAPMVGIICFGLYLAGAFAMVGVARLIRTSALSRPAPGDRHVAR